MNARTKAFVLIVVLWLAMLGALLAALPDVAHGQDKIPPTNGRRPMALCQSADGSTGPVPCVYLATQVDEMPLVGNGDGGSFRIYRDKRVKWITDRRAYQLLHGMPNHDRAPVVGRQSGIDTRKCATMPEFKRLPETEGKQAVERFIETRGWVAYRAPGFIVKHYEFCDHPKGWLTVSYTKHSYERGWAFDNKILIYVCTHQAGDGPVVPCDNTEVNFIEASLLNSNRSGVLRTVTS